MAVSSQAHRLSYVRSSPAPCPVVVHFAPIATRGSVEVPDFPVLCFSTADSKVVIVSSPVIEVKRSGTWHFVSTSLGFPEAHEPYQVVVRGILVVCSMFRHPASRSASRELFVALSVPVSSFFLRMGLSGFAKGPPPAAGQEFRLPSISIPGSFITWPCLIRIVAFRVPQVVRVPV